MADRRIRLLIAVVVLVWLTVFISLYYIYHKPFDSRLATGLLLRASEMFVGLVVIIAAGGIGGKIFTRISHRPLFSAACQAAIGLGIFGTGYLVIGAILGVSWITAGGVLLIVGVIFRKKALAWCEMFTGGFATLHPHSRLGKVVSLGVGVVVACGLLTALSPPLKFDALVYHLALPKQYLAVGRVSYDAMSWFWSMPQLGEMIYTLAMAIAGERAAVVLGWGIAVLALAGLWELVHYSFGPQPAWVSLAALLAGSTLSTSLGTGYVDWLVILFGVVMVGAMIDWCRTGESTLLTLAGGAIGLAAGVKYTAGILGVGGVVLILLRHTRLRSTIRQSLGSLLKFGAPAVLIFLPWLVKNWIVTGNPFYPFLFLSSELELFRQEFYRLEAWGKPYEALVLPFIASIQGIEGTPGYSASIGPLLAGLAPLAAFAWIGGRHRHLQVIESATILCLISWAIWAAGSRLAGLLIQTRLYFACLPAVALLAGAGYRGLWRLHLPGIRIGRIAGVLIMLVFSLSVFQTFELFLHQGVPQVLFGVQSDDEFRERNLGWYAAAMQAMEDLPPGVRILMLWEPRSLACTPFCTPDDVLDRWIVARRQWGSAMQIQSAWHQLGYTHLLFNDFGAAFIQEEDLRYTSADWEELRKLLAGLRVVSRFGAAYTLYELQP